MNNNELIEILLDDFTNPYNNDQVELFVKKLEESEQFEAEHMQDLNNKLILKKDAYQLHYTYDRSDLELIQKTIGGIKN